MKGLPTKLPRTLTWEHFERTDACASDEVQFALRESVHLIRRTIRGSRFLRELCLSWPAGAELSTLCGVPVSFWIDYHSDKIIEFVSARLPGQGAPSLGNKTMRVCATCRKEYRLNQTTRKEGGE